MELKEKTGHPCIWFSSSSNYLPVDMEGDGVVDLLIRRPDDFSFEDIGGYETEISGSNADEMTGRLLGKDWRGRFGTINLPSNFLETYRQPRMMAAKEVAGDSPVVAFLENGLSSTGSATLIGTGLAQVWPPFAAVTVGLFGVEFLDYLLTVGKGWIDDTLSAAEIAGALGNIAGVIAGGAIVGSAFSAEPTNPAPVLRVVKDTAPMPGPANVIPLFRTSPGPRGSSATVYALDGNAALAVDSSPVYVGEPLTPRVVTQAEIAEMAAQLARIYRYADPDAAFMTHYFAISQFFGKSGVVAETNRPNRTGETESLLPHELRRTRFYFRVRRDDGEDDYVAIDEFSYWMMYMIQGLGPSDAATLIEKTKYEGAVERDIKYRLGKLISLGLVRIIGIHYLPSGGHAHNMYDLTEDGNRAVDIAKYEDWDYRQFNLITSIEDTVLESLRDGTSLTRYEIEERHGWPIQGRDKVLRTLVDLGLIAVAGTRDGEDLFGLTALGQRHVERGRFLNGIDRLPVMQILMLRTLSEKGRCSYYDLQKMLKNRYRRETNKSGIENLVKRGLVSAGRPAEGEEGAWSYSPVSEMYEITPAGIAVMERSAGYRRLVAEVDPKEGKRTISLSHEELEILGFTPAKDVYEQIVAMETPALIEIVRTRSSNEKLAQIAIAELLARGVSFDDSTAAAFVDEITKGTSEFASKMSLIVTRLIDLLN